MNMPDKAATKGFPEGFSFTMGTVGKNIAPGFEDDEDTDEQA